MPRWAKDETLAETIARMSLERSKRKPKSGGFNLAKKSIDVVNATRTKKLLTTVYRKAKLNRNLETDPNYHKGVNIFASLARELNNQARLDKVLDWYCSHSHGKYTPQITNVSDFKNKFLKLEIVMCRAQELSPDVVISGPARRLTKRLEYHHVEEPHRARLELMVAVSLYNITKTFNWIAKKYGDQDCPCYSEFTGQYLSNMEDWACEKYQTGNWWSKLDPMKLVFRANTPRFKRTMKMWGKVNNLPSEDVNEIIKGVNECVSMK